ncbi:MAG: hypothetical protein ACE367_16015 [Acidimicrobiales bacterium]
MARDGAPNDTGDTGDEIVVPITAPGTEPRDFTISPGTPAESNRSTEPTSTPRGADPRHDGTTDRSSGAGGTDDHRRGGADHRSGGTDDHRTGETGDRRPGDTGGLVDDDLAHDFGIGGLGPDPHSTAAGHVVGHDRLADVVATFGSTLESIRASQGRAPRHNLPTGSGTNQKRIAQVVQATPIDATRVVELIRSNAARIPLLALDADDPAVGRGDVVFPGRLRMPGGTRRRVELRVYPTTSGNLTVLELLPRRSWMPQTRRYLRAGVPAITALSDAIEEAAARS